MGKPTWANLFWTHVDTNHPSGCWVWDDGRFKSGYGRFYLREQRRVMLAHRLSWELRHGQIPKGLFVCHHCDNPPCVRPDHLFLGTPKDNTADMHSKGRAGVPRGENHPQAKLKVKQVLMIRDMLSSGVPVKQIAGQFGMSERAILDIKNGKKWRELGPIQLPAPRRRKVWVVKWWDGRSTAEAIVDCLLSESSLGHDVYVRLAERLEAD
jgi:HNH endonuclease